MKLPVRYIPSSLTRKDRVQQKKEILKSKRMYKQGRNRFYTRKHVASFRSRRSSHLSRARKIYHIDNLTPNRALAKKTGCSLAALKKIVEKGEGAYYSSGSRPNQTPHSWGLARLASSLTSGKSAAVDYDILEKGCNPRKTAFRLAKEARKKYGYGHGKTRKTWV